MELVKQNNLILKTVCKKFDFTNPPFDPIEFSQNLIKFMYDHNAITITANQVGEPYNIFGMRGMPENFVCFNSRIVQPSEEEILLEETCLTYPGLLVKIKRPRHVRVRFQTPNGDTRTETFTGLTARTFQHSLDYLNGITYYNRANKYHKEIAFKKWKL
jgi:peptide deformylase